MQQYFFELPRCLNSAPRGHADDVLLGSPSGMYLPSQSYMCGPSSPLLTSPVTYHYILFVMDMQMRGKIHLTASTLSACRHAYIGADSLLDTGGARPHMIAEEYVPYMGCGVA